MKEQESLTTAVRVGLESFLKPWYQSLDDPRRAQQYILEKLLEGYRKTRYGLERKADTISTIEEFKDSFPVLTYNDLKPYIEMVMGGDFQALLPEPPVEWGMTRGTTGESKYVPLTKTDLEQRVTCGPRAVMSYVYRTEKYDILGGQVLNLNFPSVAGSMQVEGKEITYGYTSGIYARHNAERAQLKLVPEQEEIDALGAGLTREDWEKRFDLAYTQAKGKNVTMFVGVTQTMLQFGRYLKRRWKAYPKDLWDIDLLICTSIAGIHTKYKPALKALYGDTTIIEMYGATEGMYAQQMDDRPYMAPNYDTYFFEVETRRGIKMLHQLERGEYGSLIISSCLFPRYKIGDLIRCVGEHYYYVIGREKRFAVLKHFLEKLWNLGF